MNVKIIDRSRIHAWQVCDEDVVGAETWEEAITWYVRETGIDRDNLYAVPKEVPLTKTLWSDETRTLRITYAQSIADASTFPSILSTTEF